MNRLFTFSSPQGMGLGRWWRAGLLSALVACAHASAWAAPTDGYTDRLVAEFAPWVGSPHDTELLVQSLRSGRATGSGATSVAPATGAMAYGEVRLALKLAQGTLAQAGISQPNAAQLQAALHGGELDTPAGSQSLPGVLPQRAGGQSWGAMARSVGVSVEDLIPPRAVTPAKTSATHLASDAPRSTARTKKAVGRAAGKAARPSATSSKRKKGAKASATTTKPATKKSAKKARP